MPKKIYPESEKKIKNPLIKKVWESKIKQSPSKNKHISYSSISTYNKCPKKWELMYLRNEIPFTQNIYTLIKILKNFSYLKNGLLNPQYLILTLIHIIILKNLHIF